MTGASLGRLSLGHHGFMSDTDKERFDRAVDLQVKVGIAGAGLGIPVLVLAAIDAPQWLSISYVFLMAVVLLLIILRGRSRT
jgi:hypothetical protein